MHEPWWKAAVIYQVYPRSFADSDGDGVGDLEGLRSHLDHLVWLGVDGVWLSPIYRSPMADFGYDISDHCDVDPVFGTLADADRVVAEAHERGLKVLLDWVPNHTSDQHPWFLASRSSRTDPQRPWYVWRDGGPDGSPPNRWASAFVEPPEWVLDEVTGERRRGPDPVAAGRHQGTAWTFDEATGQWYLHLFLPQQPDLEWREPAVEEAMHDVLRFWLDRGIDGFRADVIHALGKSPDEGEPTDHPYVHELIRRIRSVLDSYDGDRVMVGEVFILDTARVAEYYGGGDELHLAFNFSPLFAPWKAEAWRTRIEELEKHFIPRQAWPTWVLSNHDQPRHRTRYGSERRARAAAVLLLGLRGTPFLYAGEELGLEDAVIPPWRRLDPGGRDGCRAPLPWTPEAGHGWGASPWLPFPPDAAARSVEAMREDEGSILHLYRRLLAARKGSPALQLGDLELLEGPEGVVVWMRARDGDRRLVAVNFGTAADLAVEGRWSVEVASDGAGEGQPFDGRIGADTAVVLRPA